MHARVVAQGRQLAVLPLWAPLIAVIAAALVALVSQSSATSELKLRAFVRRRVTVLRAIDARYFEPGACVEYPTSSGDRHLTVFLAAGHGGIDPGGVGGTESGLTIYEADETLPVELAAMKLLRAKGFTVVVSRTKAETVIRPLPGDVSGGPFMFQGVHDLVVARDLCANLTKANVLVGIYFDAGGSPYDAGAVTGYDTARSFSARNLRWATLIQDDVLDAMNAQGWGNPNLGVTDDSQLGGPALSTAAADHGHLLLLGPSDPGWFTTPSQMPGALIEPLFITDPFEDTQATSLSGQEVIAGGLAQAIDRYFAPPLGTRTPKLRRDAGLRGISAAARECRNRNDMAAWLIEGVVVKVDSWHSWSFRRSDHGRRQALGCSPVGVVHGFSGPSSSPLTGKSSR